MRAFWTVIALSALALWSCELSRRAVAASGAGQLPLANWAVGPSRAVSTASDRGLAKPAFLAAIAYFKLEFGGYVVAVIARRAIPAMRGI